MQKDDSVLILILGIVMIGYGIGSFYYSYVSFDGLVHPFTAMGSACSIIVGVAQIVGYFKFLFKWKRKSKS